VGTREDAVPVAQNIRDTVVAVAQEQGAAVPASPTVRRMARELGVDIGRVHGTGPGGRITAEDVNSFAKSIITGATPSQPQLHVVGSTTAAAPVQKPLPDFTRYGEIERTPMSKVRAITAQSMSYAWNSVPHVTQHDEADITELDTFRKQMAEEVKAQGIRVTPLAFLMKACVAALQRFPQFNASLSPEGDQLILKQYWHLGVAVDTPNGLVVPVIRDVDKKGVLQLAKELGEVSAKARDGKLSPADMQGGTFSISSLGGIGGSSFTPIINAPEVAILGASRSVTRPQWRDGSFVPRLMLPLSLSYDHRVVDGAEGARFITFLTGVLSDIRRLVL
jgi:pyruvate dehydrogenase E2 component (dihydrolipoamide acetyltransferase)